MVVFPAWFCVGVGVGVCGGRGPSSPLSVAGMVFGVPGRPIVWSNDYVDARERRVMQVDNDAIRCRGGALSRWMTKDDRMSRSSSNPNWQRRNASSDRTDERECVRLEVEQSLGETAKVTGD
jgi:hypothetical protein